MAASAEVHEVRFTTFPKLLFIWPLVAAGYILYLPGAPMTPTMEDLVAAKVQPAATAVGGAVGGDESAEGQPPPAVNPYVSDRLETIGWIYIWIIVIVALTLGVDIDRNYAAFWVAFVGLIWVLGLWLRDSKGFTFFGDLYNWFADMDVQYNRSFGLALSIFLSVPYGIMLFWARLNARWRITHNEFEHYSFGKMDDSLGRGAKTIRTSFPDVFELLLGMAGTLIVYNATGTKELRSIPHVMFLPIVRKRLNRILERTAITTGALEEEEEEDEDM